MTYSLSHFLCFEHLIEQKELKINALAERKDIYSMRILRQLLIILGVWLAGEVISRVLHLPIPGNVIGMFIMLILLGTGVVRVERVEQVSNFFLENIALFFIPSVAAIIIYYEQIKGQVLQVLVSLFFSTVLVFLVTGYTVEGLLRLKKRHDMKKAKQEEKIDA